MQSIPKYAMHNKVCKVYRIYQSIQSIPKYAKNAKALKSYPSMQYADIVLNRAAIATKNYISSIESVYAPQLSHAQ